MYAPSSIATVNSPSATMVSFAPLINLVLANVVIQRCLIDGEGWERGGGGGEYGRGGLGTRSTLSMARV